ncbi:selenium metabolism-associated LysR family transcriptional regulator [Bacillota bacterium LX-D]|nr:selenium metabolism-associated LysR family transcriptional regulator [Bacillota bacterium LX-D]
MEFKQLETFLLVTKCGSFTEAAKLLYISQPTVSIQIGALEEELGIKLFERQGKETSLTEAGKIFLKYTNQMLNIQQKALATINKYQQEISGRLTIWASSIPADYILPSLITKFIQQYPKVNIEIFQAGSQKVWSAVQNYEADLGIVGALDKEQEINAVPLLKDKLVLITPVTGKYKDWSSPLSLEDILKEPFILREEESGTQKTFISALKNKGYDPKKLNISVRMESIEAIKNTVSAGLGLSVISKMAITKEVKLGLIKQFEFADLELDRNFYLITHKRKIFSPPADKFREFMLNHASLSK